MEKLINYIFKKNKREQYSGDINLRPAFLLLSIIFVFLPVILISKDFYDGVDIDLFRYVFPAIKWISEVISKGLFGILLFGWIIGQGLAVFYIVVYIILEIIKLLKRNKKN